MMNGKFKKKFKKSNTCLSCKAAIAIGRPINPILGIKFLTEAPDFTYGGILPLVWQRSYYSDQQGTGWLGQGWATPFSQQLHRSEHGFVYIDEQGRAFPLPDMQADEEPIFHESEQIWFSCDEAGHCFIANLDGSLILRFAPLTVSNDDPSGQMCSQWALVAIEDANGNHQRIIYHHLTGLPQYVIDGNGRVFYLHFGNVAEHKTHSPLWRLAAIYQLPHLPEFNTDLAGSLHHQRALVRYDYAPDGDLIAVYDQSGALTRSFAYRNHIMVAHTDAAGLVSEYEYD